MNTMELSLAAIRMERERRGWSMSELARRTGSRVVTSTVSRTLKGTTQPSWETVLAMASALGLSHLWDTRDAEPALVNEGESLYGFERRLVKAAREGGTAQPLSALAERLATLSDDERRGAVKLLNL